MKRAVYFLAFVLMLLCGLCACNQAQNEPSQSDSDKPQSDLVTVYFLEKEESTTNATADGSDYHTSTEFAWDEQGNLLSRVFHGNSGETTTTEYVYTYDENGNSIKKQTFQTEGQSKKLHLTNYYSYDEKNRLVKAEYRYSSSYNPNSTAEKDAYTVLEYDDQGRQTRTTQYSPTDQVQHVTEFTYADDGSYTKSYTTFPGNQTGALVGRTVSSYDPDGMLISSIQYDENDQVIEDLKWQFRYDGNEHPVESKKIDNLTGKVLFDSTFEYENSRLIRFIQKNDSLEEYGTILYTSEYSYDENGNTVKTVSTYEVPGKAPQTDTRTYSYRAVELNPEQARTVEEKLKDYAYGDPAKNENIYY